MLDINWFLLIRLATLNNIKWEVVTYWILIQWLTSVHCRYFILCYSWIVVRQTCWASECSLLLLWLLLNSQNYEGWLFSAVRAEEGKWLHLMWRSLFSFCRKFDLEITMKLISITIITEICRLLVYIKIFMLL